MTRALVFLPLVLLASAAAAGPAPEAYRQCTACHTTAPGALGPDLKGVVGRTAGSLAGFRYSGPLKRSGIVWTPETLRAFLADPQGTVPGNRMPFSGVPANVAAEIVKYLASIGDAAP